MSLSKKQQGQIHTRLCSLIKNRREELGISKAALSRATGLSLATIHRIEDTKTWVRLKEFILVCFELELFEGLTYIDPEQEQVAKAITDLKKAHYKRNIATAR
jgi:transcriptional regulator with XRE-family HTH domain